MISTGFTASVEAIGACFATLAAQARPGAGGHDAAAGAVAVCRTILSRVRRALHTRRREIQRCDLS